MSTGRANFTICVRSLHHELFFCVSNASLCVAAAVVISESDAAPSRVYKGVLAVSMHVLSTHVHSGEGGHRKDEPAHQFARDGGGPSGMFHQYHTDDNSQQRERPTGCQHSKHGRGMAWLGTTYYVLRTTVRKHQLPSTLSRTK
jgi:hypothetical protein